MVALSRYDVALLFKQYWTGLSWKGEDHTLGVYFDQKYGYLVERTYAVRIEHNESSPSVFYVPGDGESEDEVYTQFPFQELKKKTNKSNLLFAAQELQEEQLNELFECERHNRLTVTIEPFVALLETIPKKRERDRAWLLIMCKNGVTQAFLISKKEGELILVGQLFVELENQKQENFEIMVNANTALHAFKLFSSNSTVLISQSHDRIIFTSVANYPKMEALLSTVKETIRREIEYQPCI